MFDGELTFEQIEAGQAKSRERAAQRAASIERIQDFVTSHVRVVEGEVEITAPTEGDDLPDYATLRSDIFVTFTYGDLQDHVPMDTIIAVGGFVGEHAPSRGEA